MSTLLVNLPPHIHTLSFLSDMNFKSLGHQCHWTPHEFFFKIATHVTKKTTLKWLKHQL